jgi:hypothetical protein
VFKFMVNLCHLMRISQAKLINPAYKGPSSLIMSDVLYRGRILLRRT